MSREEFGVTTANFECALRSLKTKMTRYKLYRMKTFLQTTAERVTRCMSDRHDTLRRLVADWTVPSLWTDKKRRELYLKMCDRLLRDMKYASDYEAAKAEEATAVTVSDDRTRNL